MSFKTTIYLPDDLKRAVEREARLRGLSEAALIRSAILAAVHRPARRYGLYQAEPVADRVDEFLEGFGQR